jgi:hypothetical protein
MQMGRDLTRVHIVSALKKFAASFPPSRRNGTRALAPNSSIMRIGRLISLYKSSRAHDINALAVVPVIAPALALDDEVIDSAAIAAAIKGVLRRLDLGAGDTPVAVLKGLYGCCCSNDGAWRRGCRRGNCRRSSVA